MVQTLELEMPEKPPGLDSLFLSALEIESPEERAAFLTRSCGDDVSLRAEVEQLLASHRVAGSFLEKPALELDATLLQEAASQDLAASLEAGLSAAFREDEAVVLGNAGHSVLQGAGPDHRILPRVVLREAAAPGTIRSCGRSRRRCRATTPTAATGWMARSLGAAWGRSSRAATPTWAATWRSRCCSMRTRTGRTWSSGSSRKRRSAGSCSIRGSSRSTSWGSSPTGGRSSP